MKGGAAGGAGGPGGLGGLGGENGGEGGAGGLGGGGGARHAIRRFGMRCSPSHLFVLQHKMQQRQHSLGNADTGESAI